MNIRAIERQRLINRRKDSQRAITAVASDIQSLILYWETKGRTR